MDYESFHEILLQFVLQMLVPTNEVGVYFELNSSSFAMIVIYGLTIRK